MPSIDFASDERLSRERIFHDRLADELNPVEMPPAPLNPLNKAMVDSAGQLAGKRVLDLGCGSGDLTVLLAMAGARVTGVDLSPGMVDVARRRVEHFVPEASAEFAAAPAEQLP